MGVKFSEDVVPISDLKINAAPWTFLCCRTMRRIQAERHLELRRLDDRFHGPLLLGQFDDAVARQCLERSRQVAAPPPGRDLKRMDRFRLLLDDDPQQILVLGA